MQGLKEFFIYLFQRTVEIFSIIKRIKKELINIIYVMEPERIQTTKPPYHEQRCVPLGHMASVKGEKCLQLEIMASFSKGWGVIGLWASCPSHLLGFQSELLDWVLKPVKLLGFIPKARSRVATSGPGCIPFMGQAQVVIDRIITSNIPK